MKNYLVVLTGLPRGGEETWTTLKKNVLEPLDADLAICTENNIDKSTNLYSMADYLWLFDEKDDWISYYKNNYSDNAIKVLKQGEGAGLWESGIIHFALKDIVLKNYLDILKKYNYIIYSRFDQFYTDIHPSFSGEFIWIPKGDDYFGINDRHAIINSKFIKDYLGICKYIDSINLKNVDNLYLNCETIYKLHLENIKLIDKVVRINRFQFTSSLKDDFTRWRIPKYSLIFKNKIKIKYPDEFLNAVENFAFMEYFRLKNFDFVMTYLYLKLRSKLGKFKKIFK